MYQHVVYNIQYLQYNGHYYSSHTLSSIDFLQFELAIIRAVAAGNFKCAKVIVDKVGLVRDLYIICNPYT